MDMVGFLFGNINEDGELEDEGLLDKDSVAGLSRLGIGLGSVLSELEGPVEEEDNYDTEEKGNIIAEDFGDINEVAEDDEDSQAVPNPSIPISQADDSTSLISEAPASETFDEGHSLTRESQPSSMEDSGFESQNTPLEMNTKAPSPLQLQEVKSVAQTEIPASTLIEPSVTPSITIQTDPTPTHEVFSVPPEPAIPQLQTSISSAEAITLNQVDSSPAIKTSEEELDSAIPALIPDNMTLEELRAKVKQLFPGFRSHGILRFSSLLSPGKHSLPRIWREAQKPKKKKKKPPPQSCTWTLDIDFEPPPEMVINDDEEKFLSTESHEVKLQGTATAKNRLTQSDPLTREWRFGPAKVWYDSIGVPEDGHILDYGFKLKDSTTDKNADPCPSMDIAAYDPPSDAFLMVTQEHWEDKILWDVPYTSATGVAWRPHSETSLGLLSRQSSTSGRHSAEGSVPSEPYQSMFPIENYELAYYRWEDDIIWDVEAVDHIPHPSLPQIDPNDPNFIIGIPEEPPPMTPAGEREGRKDAKKMSRYGGSRAKTGSEAAPVPCFQAKKDPFNISNDEYYNPKHISNSQGLSGFDGNVVQHSIPALDLHSPWFPTQLSSSALRHFHRPKLRIRCPRGEQSTGWYSVSSLESYIASKAREREKERANSGGGEVFFMRSPEDLSICDGHLVLAECSEQYPPLLSAIGLATKMKNYYRRSERQVKSHTPELPYGATTYIQNTSYFLGQLKPGQILQSFENNLYRAPVYQHSAPETDFLLIVVGNEVYIRDIPVIFVVGQECPKLEVPAPNSKPATQFQKELLQVFLYQQFRESKESPKKLKMDVIRKAFPVSIMSESVIRKVLKTCADFKREGYENGWWVLRPDFRLPTDEELRSLITPEQICAYHSMLAAEHRLKEAGYRGKSLFSVEEEEDEDSINKVDDEIRAAPWNTTHHFINASKGKYQLSVSGPADPTGCGEGFSYTRLNPKRDAASSLHASKKYKNTDGDLRRLKLSKAKTLLRNFGVSEEEISKLSRWQVIDRVRELSTEAVRSGDGVHTVNLKFARGARFSHMEAQERYRDECQKMFDLQNSVLSSTEVLSTDEESSADEGDSDSELGKNLETLLRGKKTTAQLSFEQEEAERADLRRLLSEERPSGTPDSAETGDQGTPVGLAADGDDASSNRSFSSKPGRYLIISRTFHDEDGREFVRDEVVKRQDVINAYIQLSSEVRSKFVDQDEQTREDMKKMKRKIQDQLRRLKKIEEKEKKKAQKPQKPKPLTTIKMKCSACGQKGHMKTNRNCPMYKNNPINVAPTDQELAQAENKLPEDDLVKIEGTKVVLNRAVVEHVQDVRRKSLLLKFPKSRKRRRGPLEEDLDYLETRKSVQRRKTNPEVPFSDHLEKVLQALMNLPESYHFRKPVNPKVVPDYYNVIKFPMDLQTMRDHCRKRIYKSRSQFREHINLLLTNCITYNGSGSEVTRHAQRVADVCEEELKKLDLELEQLEAEINPALDDNALVAFSYVLGKVVDCMKEFPDSWPFHVPVSSKKIPDYHKIIKTPMDLQTMKKKCSSHQYLNQDAFLADLNQIVENSITYNGPSSLYSQTAGHMREAGLVKLQSDAELLGKLEKRVSGAASPAPLLKLLEGVRPLEDEMMLLEEDLQHSSSSSDSGSDTDIELN